MTSATTPPPVLPNRTLRTVLLAVGSTALAITVVGAVVGAARTVGAAGDGTRVLAGDVATVRIDAEAADLTVRLADVDRTTVQWDPGATDLRLRADLDGGDLDVRVADPGWGPFGWWADDRGSQATLTVLLPELASGADLDLETAAGALDLDGEWGDVSIRTAAGAVRLAGAAASLDLEATGAEVVGEALEVGDLSVRSTAGRVDLGFAVPPSAIDAESTAGGLRFALPDGEYEVRTETVLGEVRDALISTPGAERVYRFESTAGDIDLRRLG